MSEAEGTETSLHHDVVIIGSGIAGLSAAIYAGRANNTPLVIHGNEPGGQLTLTTDVANYPGFPDGISGPDLINNMRSQAAQFGAEFKHGIVECINDGVTPFTITLQNGEYVTADAVIVAAGATARTLGIPGEDDLMGYGVSTCATCDGAFFNGEDMVVVGGGDAALEEAHFLTKFADTVYLMHRREEFRAEAHWQDRIAEEVERGTIELILNSEVTEVKGTADAGISTVKYATHPDGHPSANLDDGATTEHELDVAAMFIAIGHVPNTSYLADTDVVTNEEGYITVAGGFEGGQTATDVDGIFAAGDVVDFHYQQAATAGGMGVKAALDVDAYLSE